jgi:hypothetical protein
LPKRIFLPLIVFALWGGFGFWPLPVMFEHAVLPLLASAGQLLLALAAFLRVRRYSGGHLLLSPEMLSGPLFSLRATMIYVVASLVLLPFFLGLFTLASVGMYLEQQTAGFLRLTPSGIFMTERVYRKGEQTIRLAGMMHLGAEEYYRDLAASVDPGRTLVLVEGVSDVDQLLPNRFDYGGIGEALGLVSQDVLEFDGRQVSLDDAEQPDDEAEAAPEPHILRADIDVNCFDPRTVEFLKVLGTTLLNRNATGSDLVAYNAWTDEHLTPDLRDILMEDILHRRNRELLRVLRLTMDHYDSVVIPWGALHMPGIEAAVLAQGFRIAGEHRRLSLDFATIPYAGLLKRVAGAAGEGE